MLNSISRLNPTAHPSCKDSQAKFEGDLPTVNTKGQCASSAAGGYYLTAMFDRFGAGYTATFCEALACLQRKVTRLPWTIISPGYRRRIGRYWTSL